MGLPSSHWFYCTEFGYFKGQHRSFCEDFSFTEYGRHCLCYRGHASCCPWIHVWLLKSPFNHSHVRSAYHIMLAENQNMKLHLQYDYNYVWIMGQTRQGPGANDNSLTCWGDRLETTSFFFFFFLTISKCFAIMQRCSISNSISLLQPLYSQCTDKCMRVWSTELCLAHWSSCMFVRWGSHLLSDSLEMARILLKWHSHWRGTLEWPSCTVFLLLSTLFSYPLLLSYQTKPSNVSWVNHMFIIEKQLRIPERRKNF